MQGSTIHYGAIHAGAFARLVAGCLDWFAERRQARRDIARLSLLDDRLLADIGFTRDQVERAEWHGRLPQRHFG